MTDYEMFQQWIKSPAAGYCRKKPDGSRCDCSEGQRLKSPDAWLAVAADGSESSAVYAMKEQAEAAAREWGWMTVPLYRHPQPTLTDEEREAIERGADALDGIEDLSAGAVGADAAAVFTLRSLLARTQTVRK